MGEGLLEVTRKVKSVKRKFGKKINRLRLITPNFVREQIIRLLDTIEKM